MSYRRVWWQQSRSDTVTATATKQLIEHKKNTKRATAIMKKNVMQRVVGYAGLAMELRKVKRSTDETVRANARCHLSERMGKLRGLPQKIGQIMSMADDAEAANPFSDLTDGATPLPLTDIVPILEGAWGVPVDTILSDLEPDAAAASLGQVHRARLHDGRDVAVKVAYPGIRKAVESDLKMLGWLSAPVGDLRRGFDLDAYRQEIVRDLNEELDYRIELKHQKSFAQIAARLTGLAVPEPVESLCCEQVLVSSWEDGDRIEDVSRWPQKQRGELARRVLNHFLTMLFDHGLVHADPHPGNYRFRNDPDNGPTVVLYDYGSVTKLSTQDRLLLLRLVTDTVKMQGDPLAILAAMGFNADLLEPIAKKLPAVCRVLFEPFQSPTKFDTNTWNRTERMNDILGDDRWNFRMAGPAKLFLLMRAFRGVLYYLQRLQAPVSWNRTLDPIIARHGALASSVTIPASSVPTTTFSAMAKHLRVEVYREGCRSVSLTMPIGAIEDLENVIDEAVVRRIEARGVSLAALVRDSRRGGYAPGELFTLDVAEENKTVRVWTA